MTINQYVVAATATITAGSAATVVAGEPGTEGAAGYGGDADTSGFLWPFTVNKGQLIALDPTGPVYAAITAVVALNQVHLAQETGGNYGVSN
jgi:hypothetical protein